MKSLFTAWRRASATPIACLQTPSVCSCYRSIKGIGFEICMQLASNGVTVKVTARDEKRAIEAIGKLNDLGLFDYVLFHQLDVTNPSSIASLSHFVKTRFGVLDILVNDAGTVGASADWVTIERLVIDGIIIMKYADGTPEECPETNYFGAKRIVEEFIPPLQLNCDC